MAVAADARARRLVIAMVLGQLIAVAAVVLYATGAPLDPGGGLRQLDAMTLHQRVPGVRPVAGRPTLVVAVGVPGRGSCERQAREVLAGHGRPGGVGSAFGLRLLVPGQRVPTALAAAAGRGRGPARVQADPGGRLAAALALPEAGRGCHPGYALLDSAGQVRYRTTDPDYAAHAGEQDILLGALR